MRLADLIRGMTDEELAEFFDKEVFTEATPCDNLIPCKEQRDCRKYHGDCTKHLLEFLQSFQVSDFLYRVERRIQEEQERGEKK